MAQIDPIVKRLQEVGVRHASTSGQVALAWVMARGCIPIPGAKNEDQARENAGASQCKLSAKEVLEIGTMSLSGNINSWQHG